MQQLQVHQALNLCHKLAVLHISVCLCMPSACLVCHMHHPVFHPQSHAAAGCGEVCCSVGQRVIYVVIAPRSNLHVPCLPV